MPLVLIKSLTFALCLIPLGQLLWWFFTDSFSPNPVEDIQHYSGEWALRLLLVTLAMTPLRRLSGWRWPIRIRRMLGLFAYFYMCLHFANYLVFDLTFDPVLLAEDLIKRRYITVGFACWLFLLPLAVTSTNGWQRRLGRRWKQLHQLIYPAAILAILHFLWLVKADLLEPLIYAVILVLLLALRMRRPAK